MTLLVDPPTTGPTAGPVTRPVPRTAVRGAVPPDLDLDALAADLDAIRAEVLAELGEADAAYVDGLVRLQRRLELGGRLALWAGVLPPAWVAGVAMLGLSKILENMELGHNVMHGQWDWLRDPALHSTTWEWDNVCPSEQWKHTHNHLHHQWTNVAGMDGDLGYGLIRIDPEQPWRPRDLGQPLYFVLLALGFEYGVALQDLEQDVTSGAARATWWPKLRATAAKVGRQVTKDLVAFPLLSLPFGPAGVVAAATGAVAANVVRNVWAFSVIFCGHFPDGAEVFDPEVVEGETRGGWYRRQILGSANFEGGRIMDLLSGNLDHQIEHHLFPDLPSNRYAEIAPRVREVCERHGLAYNTASFPRQFGSVVRKVLRLALP